MSSGSAPFFPTTLRSGTVGDLLVGCTALLESEGLPEPEREAREILAAVLDVPKFWAAANAVADASPDVARAVFSAAMKRSAGAPLAYAVGRAAFRHLTIDVDERVLIPRVETELLVELLLDRCDVHTQRVADIGTGSGAIALSLAFERAFDKVVGTDVSIDAIAVASANAATLASVLKSRVQFLHGALLSPLAGQKFHAIVSNPPYISFGEVNELPADVRDWEPSVALICPKDGLAMTRALIKDVPNFLVCGGIFGLEVDVRRAGSVAELIAVDGRYRDVEVLLDLIGRERFVFARRA